MFDGNVCEENIMPTGAIGVRSPTSWTSVETSTEILSRHVGMTVRLTSLQPSPGTRLPIWTERLFSNLFIMRLQNVRKAGPVYPRGRVCWF